MFRIIRKQCNNECSPNPETSGYVSLGSSERNKADHPQALETYSERKNNELSVQFTSQCIESDTRNQASIQVRLLLCLCQKDPQLRTVYDTVHPVGGGRKGIELTVLESETIFANMTSNAFAVRRVIFLSKTKMSRFRRPVNLYIPVETRICDDRGKITISVLAAVTSMCRFRKLPTFRQKKNLTNDCVSGSGNASQSNI